MRSQPARQSRRTLYVVALASVCSAQGFLRAQSPEGVPHLHLIILLDCSGSVEGQVRLAEYREALTEFLRANEAHLIGSQAAVVQFGTAVRVVEDRLVEDKDDISALAAAVRTLESEDLWTETTRALQDALKRTTSLLRQNPRSSVLIVFVTDGLYDPCPDSGVHPTTDDLRRLAHTEPIRPGENLFFWPCWLGEPDAELKNFVADVLQGEHKEPSHFSRRLPVLRATSRSIATPVFCVGPVEWEGSWGLSYESSETVSVSLDPPTWHPELPVGSRLVLEAPTQVSLEPAESGPREYAVPFRLRGELSEPYDGYARLRVKTPGVLAVTEVSYLTCSVSAATGLVHVIPAVDQPLTVYLDEAPGTFDVRLVPDAVASRCGDLVLACHVTIAPSHASLSVDVEPQRVVLNGETPQLVRLHVRASAGSETMGGVSGVENPPPATASVTLELRSQDPAIRIEPSRVVVPVRVARRTVHVSAAFAVEEQKVGLVSGVLNIRLRGKGRAADTPVALQIGEVPGWPEKMKPTIEPAQLRPAEAAPLQTVRLRIEGLPRGYETEVPINVSAQPGVAVAVSGDGEPVSADPERSVLAIAVYGPRFLLAELLAIGTGGFLALVVPISIFLNYRMRPDPEGLLEIVSGPTDALPYNLRKFRNFWHRNIVRVGASKKADLQISDGSLGALHFEIVTERRARKGIVVRFRALKGNELTHNNEKRVSALLHDSDMLGAGAYVFRFRSMRVTRDNRYPA